MRKFFVGLALLCPVLGFASPLKSGEFIGKTSALFAKACSVSINVVQAESPRFGRYSQYEIKTAGNGREVVFHASLEAGAQAASYGELGTANGSDTSGQTLSLIVNAEGSVTSYKVVEYFSLFWHTKQKEIIHCHFN